MKKNRILSLVLAMILIMSLFAGCAEKEEASIQSPTDVVASPTEIQPEPEEEEEPEEGPVETPELDGYDILWSDEFNGTEIDDSIWRFELHPPRYVNSELQEYTADSANAFIRNGKLVIKAIKYNEYGSDHYSSAKLTTMKKKDFTYGKICVRAKVPEGQGLWPAIWMMPTKQSYGSWPRCGEIDIMEILGHDVDTAYGNLHYGDPHADQQGTYNLTGGETFANGYHEFGLEWEPGVMKYYIDGELYHTINDWYTSSYNVEKPFPAPFDIDFYLQLNLAVGGTWPGDPDETTNFDKAEFCIDYVRVYQKAEYDTNVTRPEKQFSAADETGNYLINGDFSEKESVDDDTAWKFMAMNGGAGSAEIKDNAIVVTTKNEGTVDYSLQLVQASLPMIQGKRYRLSFDAWADEPRTMKTCVSAPSLNYDRYMQDTTVSLTTEKTSFSYEFDMTAQDDNNGRVEFNMGKSGSTATLYITNVRLEQVG